MSPLAHPIDDPAPRVFGAVGLRAIRPRDAKPLRALLAENRAWLEPWEASFPGGGGPVPGTMPMRPIIRLLKRAQRAGSSVPFAVTYRETLVGQLTISDIGGGALCSASLGYWVAQHVAGLGITPAAVALAIDFAFDELKLHRIEICIRPENRASLRIVEKLALRFEGRRERYIHINGAWRDHEAFAITREERGTSMLARLGAAPE